VGQLQSPVGVSLTDAKNHIELKLGKLTYMTIRLLIIFSLFFQILSCDSSTTQKQYKKTESQVQAIIDTTEVNGKTTTQQNKWEKTNDYLFSNYQQTIDYSDINAVIDILESEKLIHKKTKINNTSLPTFCYLSPTVMLNNLNKDNSAYTQNGMKILSDKDQAFILDQDRLRASKEFKWEFVTDNYDTTDTFPQYKISIPVFSLDKSKFIVCIEEYKDKKCLSSGISYLFVKNNKRINHYIFDKVTGC